MKEQSSVYHYMNPTKTIPHFEELLNGKSLHGASKFLFAILNLQTDYFIFIVRNLNFSSRKYMRI